MDRQKCFQRVFKVLRVCIFMALVEHLAFATELTLDQAICSAVDRHPVLKAGVFAAKSYRQQEKVAQSSYYPQISAMALETVGFQGSAAATGVEGLMVSPFHKSPSVGLFLKQNIWDFGRTTGTVSVAEKETTLSKKNTLVDALKVGEVAQQTYHLCSRDRSLAEVYSRIVSESELIQKEVENFVRVGQRSVVDSYLSKSQTEEVKTMAEDYKRRFELDNQRVAYLTGKDAKEPLCPLFSDKTIQELKSVAGTASASFLLAAADARTEVSQAQKRLALKDYHPKLVGIASLGWMNGTELGLRQQYYSAAIALIVPIFEGLKTVSDVHKHELSIIQSEKQADATRFGIDEANINYDRNIESAQIRMKRLKDEALYAEEAFQTAKKRYFDLQGTLVDLREATRNLARTSGELKVAFYDLATQSTAKALLNGQWNEAIQSQTSQME
jgi:outer membrane protein